MLLDAKRGWMIFGVLVVSFMVLAAAIVNTPANTPPSHAEVETLRVERAQESARASLRTSRDEAREDLNQTLTELENAEEKLEDAEERVDQLTEQVRDLKRTLSLRSPSTARSYARSRLSAAQFSCLDSLWTRESNWRVTATNPTSGAYGIPQALPGEKMASAGDDWQTNGVTQVKWGLGYIADVYGTPCDAWAFWQANGWY